MVMGKQAEPLEDADSGLDGVTTPDSFPATRPSWPFRL